MSEKVSGIYKIINKIDGKYYVGSSLCITGSKGRWAHHKTYLKYNRHHNNHLQFAVNKYGLENFEFLIIESYCGNNKLELLTIEQRYLDIAKTEQDKCYNLSFDAFGNKFLRIESKEKHSQSLKKRKVSEETKKRISVARTGMVFSSEAILNMSKSKSGSNHPLFGKHHTNETKIKMSICRIGILHCNYDTTEYTFIHKITNEIYTGTQYNFVKKYNLNAGNVNSMINGRKYRKNVSGWKMI